MLLNWPLRLFHHQPVALGLRLLVRSACHRTATHKCHQDRLVEHPLHCMPALAHHQLGLVRQDTEELVSSDREEQAVGAVA